MNAAISDDRRRAWLAERVSRTSPKISTWDVIGADRALLAERKARRMTSGITYES